MGKRSNFKKRKNDAYFTPLEPVIPLIPHLPQGDFVYAEPCAGDGRLVKHLSLLTQSRAIPYVVTDIDPKSPLVTHMDAMDVELKDETDLVITNPPWTRQILHPMIEHFSAQKPTWFLFDADWMHTKQAIPYLKYCRKIVSVGRVKWIEDSKSTGKDNSAWYLFDQNSSGGTLFYGL